MFTELHGGRSWVEDREGGGASFRVFLPGESQEEIDRRAGRFGRGDRSVDPARAG
jgi:hypothetical protein